MRIAVTGTTGFIGGALVDYLKKQGHDVIALVRTPENAKMFEKKGIQSRICDITDRETLFPAFKGVHVVIHLAALFNRPEASWQEYRRVNVEGTGNVLAVAAEAGVHRVVHCSTVGVATGKGRMPYSEETPYSAPEWDKYETTKCEGEKVALEFHRSTGFPVVVVRPAQVYGPGDRGKAKFYRMVKKGIMVNPGKTLKHLIYIDDLCRAFELAAMRDEGVGKAIIIAGGEPVRLTDLITIAAGELGVPVPRNIIPAHPMTWLCTITEAVCNTFNMKPVLFRRSMDFFTKSVAFDIHRSRELLGFQSSIDVQTGVANTVTWYREQGLL